jgi:hypothetical protein
MQTTEKEEITTNLIKQIHKFMDLLKTLKKLVQNKSTHHLSYPMIVIGSNYNVGFVSQMGINIVNPYSKPAYSIIDKSLPALPTAINF